MARYIGPKTKIARKFREPIFGPDRYFEKEVILRECMVLLKSALSKVNMQFS